jgi:NAD(P)-dependent dehydrogenase (short-subunit alcohol dehydrogenase family)
VKAKGRRIVADEADVRDLGQVQKVVDAGLGELGRIDIVCANAGVGSWSVSWEMSEQVWKDMIDVNLTGVFNTVRAALPSMVERGEGGSVVLTSSTAGLIGYQNTAHYTAAKHGVIGLMKVLSQELGPHRIRVNAICPTTVNTPLVVNDATFRLFAPDVVDPGPADVRDAFAGLNSLPDVPWIEPLDVSEAVAWLCSDAARYITGIALPIDAGNTAKKG